MRRVKDIVSESRVAEASDEEVGRGKVASYSPYMPILRELHRELESNGDLEAASAAVRLMDSIAKVIPDEYDEKRVFRSAD